MKFFAAMSFSALFISACGPGTAPGKDSSSSSTSGGLTSSSSGAASTSSSSSSGGVQRNYQPLVGSTWTLQPGSEKYFCTILSVPNDIYVHAFRPAAPLGTHHTVLSIVDNNIPEGTFECDGFANGNAMIYGSGVGTEELVFPDGVAVRLRAGQKMLLNLHLFNTDPTSVLTGMSGVEVETLEAAQVVHEAEQVLMGRDSALSVPPGASTQTGTCTLPREATVFAMFPHMHKSGTNMRVTTTLNGAMQVLFDRPYNFEDQRYELLSPAVALPSGARIRVECSYQNDSGATKTFGESSNDEMCYAAMYRYPPANTGGITCTN